MENGDFMPQLERLIESLRLDQEADVDEGWELTYNAIKAINLERNCQECQELSQKNVDQILDDVIPLFFRHWAKNKQISKATFNSYMSCTKIRHELMQLKESGSFTATTIKSMESRQKAIDESLRSLDKVDGSSLGQALNIFQLQAASCRTLIEELKKELDSVSPALIPIRNRLVEISLELQSLLSRKNPSAFALVEVHVLQDDVCEIDSARIDGKFLAIDGSVLPGQASVINLIENCYDDIHELLASRDPLTADNPLREVFEDLIEIRHQLESMYRFSIGVIRDNDLVPIQIRLGKIDDLRQDGKFLGPDGSIPPGQGVLHFQLHKCYRLIHKIQHVIEPVGEFLVPIYNKLSTLKKCLDQLKQWNVELSFRELIPYQMKLTNISSLQKDGKFYDENGEIPEGQAIVIGLMEECHELLHEMKTNCAN